ncbi:MAG: recombinase family protein [Anaerolineae bacterium]|nr:recombinase family protein [Anaerolineae bacterium]
MPQKLSSNRTIALCYVRQSYTRNESDMSSPEHQRANIDAFCKSKGWIPEWYEDAEGHKSGRYVSNRPGWQALEQRLKDPDVVALVANDLARLHRKTWRVGQLMDRLDELGVALVLAAPSRQIDTSTDLGRMMITILAMQDEAYANDISQRTKDSIEFRKSQGKTVGLPPFGTARVDGYLVPSEDGAWYMPDGTFQAGVASAAPHPDAIWRSYYECAKYVLEIFAEGNIGADKIAYRMNAEGWPFCNRQKQPRSFMRGDVRRIIANWPEYGGFVSDNRAKDRPGYEDYVSDEIPFNEDRAVFPIQLLRDVAQLRKERSIRPADDGMTKKAYPYPLSAITYCAHCEALAKAQNNPSLRTPLTGKQASSGNRRYRHRAGASCGCSNRSVSSDDLENEFYRLVTLLTISDSAIDLLTELAIQASQQNPVDAAAVEQEKRAAIALCRKRIDAAVTLFADGMIDKAEYRKRVEQNQREIAHWENRTTEIERKGIELRMCMEVLGQLAELWNESSDEDKQGLARMLFEYVVFDLDTRRITDFRLKSWADEFVVLRSILDDDDPSNSNGNTDSIEGNAASSSLLGGMKWCYP